ncbi:MAG TPA: sulfotransferase domain-containing protein, partial [Chitinophagaceae bacterium]|nr:sulfotransferase domain-containing protein [Chitinophagaceae bacterium]
YLHHPHVVFVKYEDLLNDTTATLGKSIQDLFGDAVVLDTEKLKQTAVAFSFETQTKRKPGEEHKKSFLRKGIAGDWQNNFSTEACKIFHHYAGGLLIQLGYETNDEWCRKRETH